MLQVPLLMAFTSGIIILALTWWFKEKDFPILIRILPGTITIIVSAISFYIGYVRVRGFEGASYLFLSIFLMIFAILSFFIGKKRKR